MKTKKKYFAKFSVENIGEAQIWECKSKKEAIKDGYYGIQAGCGNSFRIVEVTTIYRIDKKVFKLPPTKDEK